MSELTMMDVARLLDLNVNGELSGQEMSDILEYERLIDEVATNVFKSKDKEYVVYLSSLIQSIALQDMLDEGMDAEIIFALAKNPGLAMLMAHVIKTTLGISILEELR